MSDSRTAEAGELRAPPARIQLRRTKGWRMPSGAVCVDRTTGFGNPFPIVKCNATTMGKSVDLWCVGTWSGPAMWFKETKAEAVTLSVDAYRKWIEDPAQSLLRDKARLALRGKTLACWCALDAPCHADVLLEIANTELKCEVA